MFVLFAFVFDDTVKENMLLTIQERSPRKTIYTATIRSIKKENIPNGEQIITKCKKL
jgi:hypothetical protein